MRFWLAISAASWLPPGVQGSGYHAQRTPLCATTGLFLRATALAPEGPPRHGRGRPPADNRRRQEKSVSRGPTSTNITQPLPIVAFVSQGRPSAAPPSRPSPIQQIGVQVLSQLDNLLLGIPHRERHVQGAVLPFKPVD